MMNLSVKARLSLGFGVLTAVILGLGVAAYRSILIIDSAAQEIDRKTEERNLADSIDVAALKVGMGSSGFVSTGDADMLKTFEVGKGEYEQAIQQLAPRVSSEDGKRMFNDIKRAHEAYLGIAEREIQLKRENKTKEAVDLLHTQEAVAFKNLDEATNVFSDHLNKSKHEIDEIQDADVAHAKLIIVISGICGVVLGVVVAGLISRSVSNAIAKIIGTIEQLAANNLAVADLEMSQDEIGKAGEALNTMKNQLRGMIQSIGGTADHVASASEEISSSAEQQAQSSATQKDQTTQVATALQEMNVTVQQVSENSSKASDASRKAAETARHGGSIVDETLAKMQVIAESVRSTASRVQELGKSSDQIGRIIGVINDIADQTNLLALNAAIEAARAGEQGRGFAVVADEVRKLAERTTTATKEIAQMIETVQQGTKLAVGAMEEGTRQVEEGVRTTNKAGEALREIIQMSEQVGDMIAQIATAATEQSSATDEINHSMEQISNLVKESASGAQQSAKACQDLSGMAFELQKIVANFNVGDSTMTARGTGTKATGSQKPHKAMAARAGD
ncbi:MAG TPA: HAMP domain-containing methyl-accepting chemotaxis protein [Terriglobales bacterium]|nr:HAMP domain-containing methyl-accepting chemotaxis protein [Terriglobales bacterium]